MSPKQDLVRDQQGQRQVTGQRQLQQQSDKPARPSEQRSQPITEKELIRMLKRRDGSQVVISGIAQRGVAFDLTPEVERKLRKGKATDQIIRAVQNAGPTARTMSMLAGYLGAPYQSAPAVEERAFIAPWNELDPNDVLALSANFLHKHPTGVTFMLP